MPLMPQIPVRHLLIGHRLTLTHLNCLDHVQLLLLAPSKIPPTLA